LKPPYKKVEFIGRHIDIISPAITYLFVLLFDQIFKKLFFSMTPVKPQLLWLLRIKRTRGNENLRTGRRFGPAGENPGWTWVDSERHLRSETVKRLFKAFLYINVFGPKKNLKKSK